MAMLARQCWKILHNPNSLLCDCTESKIFRERIYPREGSFSVKSAYHLGVSLRDAKLQWDASASSDCCKPLDLMEKDM
jgi:hypothetical protein